MGGKQRRLARQQADLPTIASTETPKGVLTGDEIRELGLVQSTKPEPAYKVASCDLRLGAQVFRCGLDSTDIEDLDVQGKTCVVIESFQSIVFTTHETIDLEKKDIVGRFDLKIRRGLEGLLLQVGPQVQPGYKGPLFGFLMNMSGSSIYLPLRKPFMTIEFSRTTRPCSFKEPRTATSLKEFLEQEELDVKELAKPNVVRAILEQLQNCSKEHGEKLDALRREAGLDVARRSMRYGKAQAFYSRSSFWLTIVVVVLSAIQVFQFFGNGCNSKQPEEKLSTVHDGAADATLVPSPRPPRRLIPGSSVTAGPLLDTARDDSSTTDHGLQPRAPEVGQDSPPPVQPGGTR